MLMICSNYDELGHIKLTESVFVLISMNFGKILNILLEK